MFPECSEYHPLTRRHGQLPKTADLPPKGIWLHLISLREAKDLESARKDLHGGSWLRSITAQILYSSLFRADEGK